MPSQKTAETSYMTIFHGWADQDDNQPGKLLGVQIQPDLPESPTELLVVEGDYFQLHGYCAREEVGLHRGARGITVKHASIRVD